MTVFLPDTNIIVDGLNDRFGRRELLQTLVAQGDILACCAITVAEVYSGARPHEMTATEKFMSLLEWVDTSSAIARQAGRLRFDWARQGVTLSVADTLLAATAMEYGLTLITDNRKHFPMPELAIYDLPLRTQ